MSSNYYESIQKFKSQPQSQIIESQQKQIAKHPFINIRNYVRGVFKISEITMSVNTDKIIPATTGAFFSSADIGTAKQIFRLVKNNNPIKLDGNCELIIIHEFPDLEDSGTITKTYSIPNPELGVIETIIPSNILGVGTTRMVQYIYVLFDDGRKIDVGIVESNINRARIDKEMHIWEGVYNQRFEELANRLEQEFRDRLDDLELPGNCDNDGGGDNNDEFIISWEDIENKPDVFPSTVEKIEGLNEVISDINEDLEISINNIQTVYSVNNNYEIQLDNEYAQIFYLILDINGDTYFNVKFSSLIKSSQNGLIEGYFEIDGQKCGIFKQTVSDGWHTIGIPFVVKDILMGEKIFSLYMKADNDSILFENETKLSIEAAGVSSVVALTPDRDLSDTITSLPVVTLKPIDLITGYSLGSIFNQSSDEIKLPVTYLKINDSMEKEWI